MDLEENTGVHDVRDSCESCGVRLTAGEMQAALEGVGDSFLCARCASERVSVEEDAEEV